MYNGGYTPPCSQGFIPVSLLVDIPVYLCTGTLCGGFIGLSVPFHCWLIPVSLLGKSSSLVNSRFTVGQEGRPCSVDPLNVVNS